MAYLPHVGTVTSQPKQYDIHSNFGMFPGERLLYHSELKTGCCQLDDWYFTSVTDLRYIARKEFCICCGCCAERPYDDICIYLSDVAELQEVREGTGCCQGCRLDCCSCCCFCMTSKHLQLRGSFGSHVIHIPDTDRSDFEVLMAEAIGRHKLPYRQ